MKVKISDLQRLSEMLFRHLNEKGIELVEVDFSFYWKIGADERYNMADDPKEILVGSLEDDGIDIQRILSGQQPVLASHFQQLASIADALGVVLAEKLAAEGG